MCVSFMLCLSYVSGFVFNVCLIVYVVFRVCPSGPEGLEIGLLHLCRVVGSHLNGAPSRM